MAGSGLTVAWSKGRLGEELHGLMAEAGLRLEDAGRRLWSVEGAKDMRFLELKSVDVITVVERGVADLGMVGKDMILEYPSETVEIMDLDVGRCRLCVAGPRSVWEGCEGDWRRRLLDLMKGRQVRVATRYPRLTTRLLQGWNVDAIAIGLSGSVELAPAMGLSDIILDVVSTGQTLAANDLVEVSELMPISARLVGNPGSLYLKSPQIRELCSLLRTAAAGRGKAS